MAYYLNGYTPPADIVSAEQVKALQKQLNAQGAGLSVDGVYGPRTDEAYRAYSLANGLQTSSLVPDRLMSTYQDLYERLNANAPAYVPTSGEEHLKQITAALGPGYDRAVETRRQQTAAQKAEIDADAAARGMGSSTWVTDMKDRQARYEAEDVSALEGQRASAIAAQLWNALQGEKQLQYSYDALAANREANARTAALSLAQGLYGEYLSRQNGGGGGGRGGEGSDQGDLYHDLLITVKQMNKDGLGVDPSRYIISSLQGEGYDRARAYGYTDSQIKAALRKAQASLQKDRNSSGSQIMAALQKMQK